MFPVPKGVDGYYVDIFLFLWGGGIVEETDNKRKEGIPTKKISNIPKLYCFS